jgi:ribosomal protein L37AE/L43A
MSSPLEKTEQHRVVEFECPECGHKDHMTGAEGTKACGKCNTQWKKKEHWRCHTLTRRFVSKLDYDHYMSL